MTQYPYANDGYWEYGEAGFPIVGGVSEDVLENFEHGSLTGYGGDYSAFDIQNQDVLRGRFSLKATSDSATLGDDGGDVPTPRGSNSPIEYRARIVCQDGGWTSLLTNVQDESQPFENCYALAVDAEKDELRLYRRQNGRTYYFEETSVTIEDDTEYRPFITLTSEGINGGLRNRDDDLITRTDSYRDVTFVGGGLGWRSSDDAPFVYDHATHHSGTMEDVSRVVIDDYEDGNLAEYDWPSSSGSHGTSPSAAYDGDYGLEMKGFGQVFTLPGMGLDNYIRDGVKFSVRMYFLDNDGQYWMYLCPHGTDDPYAHDHYSFEVHMDDYARIYKDRDSMSGEGTSQRTYASTGAIHFDTYEWYRFEILVDSSEGITVEVYDDSSNEYLGYVQGYDTEHIDDDNGFGFFCSGSGHMYVDEIEEISD